MQQEICTTVKIKISTEELKTILRKHLLIADNVNVELTIDDGIIATENQDQKNNLLYPDDSGKWIETNGVTSTVPDSSVFEILTRKEREQQSYTRFVYCPEDLYDYDDFWGEDGEKTVVAYKLI